MKSVHNLRESFTGFFRSKNHRIVPSSSLLPKNDPTLLFTTAGMVQFKPMFAGTAELEYTRAASVQKCLRTSDLENVGKTKRHLTFFEMLGNFSFGDYFKDEAVEFAWDYSVNVIGFPEDKVWVSIYEDDDEAFRIWNKRIGMPGHRIVRLGRKDNFWGPAGASGACGPCSELYLDRGESFGCGAKECKPGCECERFLEYWNLVFNQFNQDESGKLNPLPRTGIDTGMGLERLATLVQGVDSVYGTDELAGLVRFVCDEAKVKYDAKNSAAVNTIVEHARALTFAMSDGIYPSNEGRGYVLRRILRRAMRFSRQLGIDRPFIYKVVDPLVKTMGDFYPEIKTSSLNVKTIMESEEKRFLETLDNGMDRLAETMKKLAESGEKQIPGMEAFVLHDTFGFPLEMTLEIARENGLEVDMNAYEREMEVQRSRGKQSWKGSGGFDKAFGEMSKLAGDSVFLGYDNEEAEATVAALYAERACEELSGGDKGLVVLNQTPFYGESGGQAGDTGEIISRSGALFRVHDTKKFNRTIIHIGEAIRGNIIKGEKVTAKIDSIQRNLTRANHTATHLLQASLRKVLGGHVKQAGSLVEPERFRFDFSHFGAMTGDEIAKVEEMVNGRIWEHLPVETTVMKLDEAMKTGAMAVFDEKYEDTVRVVSVEGFSKELCGGTHVSNTGEIGVFKILRESSPGAGMRRIEAVTLKGLLDRYNEQSAVLRELTLAVNAAEWALVKKVRDIIDSAKALEKEIGKARSQNIDSVIGTILSSAKEANGVKILSHVLTDTGQDEMRILADKIRGREQKSVVILGSQKDGKAFLIAAATAPAVGQGADCGKIIKEISKIVGGGGGGRKDMAQAGGTNPAGLAQAVEAGVNAAMGMIGI